MTQVLQGINFLSSRKKHFLLSLMLASFFSGVNATTWYVNDASTAGDVFTSAAGNDGNAGTAAAPFATLQFAINTAVAGDTINVDAGTYASGDITVSKSLTLRGAKFGVSAGPAATPAGRGTDETIIQAAIYYGQSVDNISVDGFTVNVGSGIRAIQARGLNSIIINNIVTGVVTPLVQQAGISTRANSPLRTHSYLISHNNVRGFRFGIYMDGNIENSSEISYNYVTSCFTDGFIFSASNGHHIKANVSVNNGTGMEFSKGSNLIEQNTISGNNVIGIRLAASPFLSGNTIMNNFFINNGIALALTDDDAGATGNTANFNSFTGNVLNVGSEHSANLNAQCNWWGTTTAPLIALQINGNVNFNPYLSDGTDTDPSLDGFQPVTACMITPVILTSFAATVKNYDVLLNWQTVSEINSSHFIIERSLDNQHFSSLGRVEAKGFSDTKSNYNFTDNKPLNFDRPTYYRLMMVDKDGATAYSKIISVVLKTNGSYVQQVYPNPAVAGGTLHVDFISGAPDKVDISLINASGQVVSHGIYPALKGSNQFLVPVPAQAGGTVNFLLIRSADAVRKVPVYIH